MLNEWKVLKSVCMTSENTDGHQTGSEQGHQFLDEEAMHLVYAVCGKDVKQEFLTSLTSFYLFAISSLLHSPSFYHVHVVSDGSVVKQDLAFLRPNAHFKASIHPPYRHSVELFKLCSTERIYLHEHEDFRNMDEVNHPRRSLVFWGRLL